MASLSNVPSSLYIVFGGESSERRVSVASAQNLLKSLDSKTLPLFLSVKGEVFLCLRDELLNHQNPFVSDFIPRSPAVSNHFKDFLQSSVEAKNSVYFLALHGLGAEDGKIQKILEELKIAFTGSGAEASRKAFDKVISKKIAREKGVLTAQSVELRPPFDPKTLEKKLQTTFESFQKKIAIKPIADGSSVGLRILESDSDFPKIALEISQESRSYLIEKFVEGTELTVGVVDDGKSCYALPPSEVRLVQGGKFDYDAKYLGRGAEELTPARVSASITHAAQQIAVEMHKALGCEGYSRTDMIAGKDGIYYLETNTLPGISGPSFFPQQLQCAGSSLGEFARREIERVWQKKRPD